jgi:hypothetical protein
VAVYLGGRMRDAHVNVSLLFQCAAVVLLVCCVLVLCVKPRKPAGGGGVA